MSIFDKEVKVIPAKIKLLKFQKSYIIGPRMYEIPGLDVSQWKGWKLFTLDDQIEDQNNKPQNRGFRLKLYNLSRKTEGFLLALIIMNCKVYGCVTLNWSKTLITWGLRSVLVGMDLAPSRRIHTCPDNLVPAVFKLLGFVGYFSFREHFYIFHNLESAD